MQLRWPSHLQCGKPLLRSRGFDSLHPLHSQSRSCTVVQEKCRKADLNRRSQDRRPETRTGFRVDGNLVLRTHSCHIRALRLTTKGQTKQSSSSERWMIPSCDRNWSTTTPTVTAGRWPVALRTASWLKIFCSPRI